MLFAVACGGGDDGGNSDRDGGGDGDGGDGDGDGGGDGDGDADADVEDLPPLTAAGVSTLTGADTPGLIDGIRGIGRFDNPVNVVVGPDDRIYVADSDNSRVRRVMADGQMATLDPGRNDFRLPFGMVFDAGGTLYVQTDRNITGGDAGALWTINLTTGAATLVRNDHGRTRGMALLADGTIAMADQRSHFIALYNPTNGNYTTIAGTAGMSGHVNATGAAARFDEPYDIVQLADTSLLVADRNNRRIRQVTLAGVVTDFAGTGANGSADGALAAATFVHPEGMAFDGTDSVYVSDRGDAVGGHKIRKMALGAGQVSTVAGTGTAGWLDAEDPLAAQLNACEGIALDTGATFLYIADGNGGQPGPYHRVRRLGL